jgi:hypothetical protein
MPEWFPFTYSCYLGQSFLQFGQYTLLLDEGTQQGDPLGPLFFYLTVVTLVKQTRSQCSIWYMDDGALGDNVYTLLRDFRMLLDESTKFGLSINIAKCEIITDDVKVLQKFKSVVPGIRHVDTTAAMLLGAPIGCEHSVDGILKANQPQWLIGSLEWFLHRSNSLFRLFRRSGMDRL